MKKAITAGAVLLLIGGVQLSYAGNRRVEQKTEQEEGWQTQQTSHQQEKGQQASHRDWALSGYIGVAEFEDEENPDPFRPGVMHEFTSDKAFKAGFVASRYYNDFSFNLGIEFLPEVDIHDELDNTIATHSHVPIFLGVNYHFDTNFIDPYIGVGVGYSFNEGSESEFIANQGIRTEVDDSTYYFFTAGVEYPFRDRYAVFLAGQYSISDADVKGSVQTPQGTIEIEKESTLDRYEVNMGIKYFF
ncbi:MAG: hypothetical protein D3909_12665 [Candidatus Electrothrix sp. ATG1]|nr:hypothetical protein [Candidatus Electrothrix sp. ATG1]MCI5210816.1 hypothetical protein [Candidatus Electrothrix sp. ATG2]